MSEGARLVRRYRFRASHHYGRAEWTEAENRLRFGDQVEPHAHDWTLEVEVVGPVDEPTGFVVDLADLDRAVHALIRGWEGGDLNALVPEVREGHVQPTTEVLARWFHGRLDPSLPGPVRLGRVRVFESPDLGAQFPA